VLGEDGICYRARKIRGLVEGWRGAPAQPGTVCRLRLVMQTLEWSPPVDKEEIPVGGLAAHLD
jgi:hypothetical protein